MNYGFYKVASITPTIKLGNVPYNVQSILKNAQEAAQQGVSVAVFSELSLSGYSLGDLFINQSIVSQSLEGLITLKQQTKNLNTIVVVGLPYQHKNKLFNVMAVLYEGKILGLIPKQHLPNYREHFEQRYFSYDSTTTSTTIDGEVIPFHNRLLFENSSDKNFVLAIEICEDLWVPHSPSIDHCSAGATLIANGSSGIETVTKANFRRDLIKVHSAKCRCGYIYASSGRDESTTDAIYAGHNLIAENGILLNESKLFTSSMTLATIDVEALAIQRRIQNTYPSNQTNYETIHLSHIPTPSTFEKVISPNPFVSSNAEEFSERCALMLDIQAHSLARRIQQISAETVIIGLSGGLDSTLALIACVKAFDLLNKDPQDIITITMPGFGTTSRTYDNAIKLAQSFKTTLQEISIKEAVLQHFSDINHHPDLHDLTYENAQARERTQILMDVAGQRNGFVLGTGDLSELALGWATYNGDHMSMYGINAGIPKTLIKHLIAYYAKQAQQPLQAILLDVLDTPVSPELLPAKDDTITQKTEDLVGPYALHDFYLYYFVAAGFSPLKIRFLAQQAFKDTYDHETINKWLKIFIKRFFTQQFKRSALPDGPRMGSVSLSPRAGYRMPSDATYAMWLNELEENN